MNIEVGLKTVTCPHGHFYAVPHWMESNRYQCPMCASGEIARLKEQLNVCAVAGEKLEEKLERRIRALKGVVTKKTRR